MQGLILAAGMGKRLKSLTANNTKCMVKVNGVTMIERSLRILEKKHLSRIVIVVGYNGQQLIDYIGTLNIQTPVVYVNNPIYNKTNNIYSLALAKDFLCAEDTLLLESDLVFEESVVDAILDDERPTLALVDKFESWMDGTCLTLDENDCIVDFISGKHLRFADKENYYKTVNIYKLAASFSTNTYVPFLTAYEKSMGENEYYESVIKLIAMLDTKEIRAKRLNGQIWYEIDNIQDLNIAETLFAATPKEHLAKIGTRYGGYWRFPKLLDFCYLVNPYYPPEKMKDEMRSNFDTLLTQYPSGMNVNSLLASGAWGVEHEYIIVGNGAAELIKALTEEIIRDNDAKIACIYPTFEEYPNRFGRERIVEYRPQTEGLRYSAEDIMKFYDDKDFSVIVLINPDNPSGNYIPYGELIRLIEWAKARGARLIIDESFVDFVEMSDDADINDVTLIKNNILEMYDGLYVVKSISKSYGIPGARLGILASSDAALIAKLKRDVSIWNINSFGEFFLQIKEKYDKDYVKALKNFRRSRRDFVAAIDEISFLHPYETQANYVMCRVDGMTADELCAEMLERRFITKSITKKIADGNEYVRLAIRTDDDNAALLAALREVEKEQG
jgi:histidinol-phosphate/aromatic aminotransferase/cobyric acid decarboxylase-like protein/choline kinase